MNITAINGSQYNSGNMSAASSAPTGGTLSGSTAMSSSTTISSSATASGGSLGSFLTNLGIGEDQAVQLMAALLVLAILGEQGEKGSESDNLLASLGQGGLFSASSFYSSSTFSSTSAYNAEGSGITAGDGGGEAAKPVLDAVA